MNFLSKIIHHRAINKYLWMTLILSMPMGSYLFPIQTPIITLTVFRLTLILFFIHQFISQQWYFPKQRVSRYLLFFMLFFLLYATVSLLWAPHFIYAIKEIFYIAIGLAMIYQISFFMQDDFDYFNIGLKAFFLGLGIILLISIYEHFSLNHLPSDFSDHLNHIHPKHGDHKIPFATFGNPNNLAVYLVFSIILLRAYAWHTDKNKLLTNIFTALSVGIIILTNSKFSIIALIVFFIFECFLYVISKNHFKFSSLFRYSKWIGLAAFITACVYFGGQQLIGYYENPKPVNEKDSEVLMIAVQAPQQPDTLLNSNQIRLNLIKNGIHFFKESKGLGQGAGSFRYLIESDKGPYPTRGIVNPHSWIFKLLANYGILITLLFIGWLGYCAIIVIKGMIIIRKHTQLIPLIFIAGGILLTYPLISNAPSSFVTNTVNWAMLITLAITCDKILMKLKQSPKKV